jgi:hypothetical protein
MSNLIIIVIVRILEKKYLKEYISKKSLNPNQYVEEKKWLEFDSRKNQTYVYLHTVPTYVYLNFGDRYSIINFSS